MMTTDFALGLVTGMLIAWGLGILVVILRPCKNKE